VSLLIVKKLETKSNPRSLTPFLQFCHTMMSNPILGAGAFLTTASVMSLFVAAACISLPEQVFWDNSDWPSDLKPVGDLNNDDGDNSQLLDFLPLENPYLISEQFNLNSIADSTLVLTDIFNESINGEVEVETWDGSWISEFVLPDASKVPNLSELQLSCGSTWSVKVRYNNGDMDVTRTVSTGQYLILATVEGAWITEEEYDPTNSPTGLPTQESGNNNPPLLKGTVLFAQSQIIPSKHRIADDSQPHLTALRKTLVMLRPHNIEEAGGQLKMSVRDADGTVVSSDVLMNQPDAIPKQDGWIELGDTDIDDINFPPSLANPYIIQYQYNLNEIGEDEQATVIADKMNNVNKEIEVKTWNGSWVPNIYLPEGSTVPADSMIQFTIDSGYHVNVYYPNTVTGGWRYRKLSLGQIVIFVLVNNVWLSQDDLEHNRYVFGRGFYTATLEAQLIRHGMTLEFAATSDSNTEEKVGILDEIKIGGVTELVITAIDVGFLTPPRNQFTFRNDETAHTEYFETTPVSRLVVAQYESMHLTEVILPSGKRYTVASDDEGGWHSGDMRQYIGKILMSHGVDLANYGISSSHGASESPHPFTCALLAGHNTVGMYRNGLQVHGGSGGNGMITLDSSIGNELSHEVGHNYGLGHYVGGFDGSVHRPSNVINSSWGWDSQKNMFRPNFDAQDTGLDRCLDNECQSPYMDKYRYGTDSMAGGYPMWGSNRFTMYTPYVAKRIQTNLEGKAVWDPTSSTGFRKFDEATNEMKEFVNNSNNEKVPRLYRVPVTTIVGYYDPSQTRGLQDYVYPAMHGAYGFVYEDDGDSETGSMDGCKLYIKIKNSDRTSNGESTLVYSLTIDLDSNFMNKFHVNVATEDKPYDASIYCYSKLRTSRPLHAPRSNEPLIFTRNGIAFDDNGNIPTESPTPDPVTQPTKAPTITSTNTPTNTPTNKPSTAPTKNPTKAPTSLSPCSEHQKKKKCRKDKANRCKWEKVNKQCISQPCSALKTYRKCKKGGCKWKRNKKKCIDR